MKQLLEVLCPQDAKRLDTIVKENEGGSIRGSIQRAIEALTDQYCPTGIHDKLRREMEELFKHQDMTVHEYTREFRHLYSLYSLVPTPPTRPLTPSEISHLYSVGMAREWQEQATRDGKVEATVGELESLFKHLERTEQAEDYHRQKLRRRGHLDTIKRECNYCREHTYGHGYKTHSDDRCYRNPSNTHCYRQPRAAPRGKYTAVFGPVKDEPPQDESCSARQCNPETSERNSENAPVLPSHQNHGKDSESNDPKAAELETFESANVGITNQPQRCEDHKSSNDRIFSACSENLPHAPLMKPCEPQELTESLPRPWVDVFLSLVGPFGQTDWCVLAIVDAATQFVALSVLAECSSEEVTRAVGQEWLSRYPWPLRFIYSNRVPAYDPDCSTLKSHAPNNGCLPRVEPAPSNMMSMPLLQLYIIIEMKVIDLQPQSQTDWDNLVCVVRLLIQTARPFALPSNTTDSGSSKEVNTPETIPSKLIEVPLNKNDSTQVTGPPDVDQSFNATHPGGFGPDDFVFITYGDAKGCRRKSRREGPYRVEAVRDNGTVVVDKGKYMEQIHAKRLKRVLC